MSNSYIPFSMVEGEIDLTVGSEANWDTVIVPIPKDALIITTDTIKFRQGNGTLLFSQLPDSATVAAANAGNANLFSYLSALSSGNDGDIIIIENELYQPSSTLVATISEDVASIAADDVSQNVNLNIINQQFAMVNPNVNE